MPSKTNDQWQELDVANLSLTHHKLFKFYLNFLIGRYVQENPDLPRPDLRLTLIDPT